MSGTTLRTQLNQGHHVMTPYGWLQRWSGCLTMAITMTVVLSGCANVPRHYVRMAEPGTTLTALTAHPEMYRGKVVLLGGTIIEEELDQDYKPHRPADMNGPEAGSYWVVVAKQQLPSLYRQWARITVVGQVTGTQRFKTEPVLSLLYVRGWGINEAHHGVWENVNPNYIFSTPGGIKKN